MGTNEAVKEKVEAQIQLWEAKLGELKAQINLAKADHKLKYQSQVVELEGHIETAKAKSAELKESGEHAWVEMKDGIEHAFSVLKEASERAADAFRR